MVSEQGIWAGRCLSMSSFAVSGSLQQTLLALLLFGAALLRIISGDGGCGRAEISICAV